MTQYKDLCEGCVIKVPRVKKFGNGDSTIMNFLTIHATKEGEHSLALGDLPFLTVSGKMLYNGCNFLLKFKEQQPKEEWWQFAPDEIEIISTLCLSAKVEVQIKDDEAYQRNFKYTGHALQDKLSVFHIGNRWFTELAGSRSLLLDKPLPVFIESDITNCLEEEHLHAVISTREEPFVLDFSTNRKCFIEIFMNEKFTIKRSQLHAMLNVHKSVKTVVADT